MNIRWTDNKDKDGVSVQEFALASKHGRDVTGALWRPNITKPTRLACFGHGASGDRYQWPIPILAHQLSIAAEAVCVSLDGPFHGLRRSDVGDPRQLFIQGLIEGSVMDRMVEDWQVAIQAITNDFDNAIERTGYFGLSMGTILGLPFIQTNETLVAAVLGLAGTAAHIPGSDRLRSAAAEITAPVLYLMNLEDEFFSQPASLDLFDRIASSDKRLHANKGAHDQLPEDEVTLVLEFLTDHLTRDKTRPYRSIIDGSPL